MTASANTLIGQNSLMSIVPCLPRDTTRAVITIPRMISTIAKWSTGSMILTIFRRLTLPEEPRMLISVDSVSYLEAALIIEAEIAALMPVAEHFNLGLLPS